MGLKKKILRLIEESGKDQKSVLAILDTVRKSYHNPKNIGDKIVSQKSLSKSVALIHGTTYPVSQDKMYAFYKGSWRKIYYNESNHYISYLRTVMPLRFKKNK